MSMEWKVKEKTIRKILVTNDDGIGAEGIWLLAGAARDFGEVIVVAPEMEQSATSHSITVGFPLELKEYSGGVPGVMAYTVNGRPADCVSTALRFLGFKPDLVFSGINHGPNLGHDILYSGTVGAASEGTAMGIPAAAFSAASHNLALASRELGMVLEHFFNEALWRSDTLLNVNFPFNKGTASRGIRYTRMGILREASHTRHEAEVLQASDGGQVLAPETDLVACGQGYISVTPLTIDRTNFQRLEQWRSKS